jgi:hypothetical protein
VTKKLPFKTLLALLYNLGFQNISFQNHLIIERFLRLLKDIYLRIELVKSGKLFQHPTYLGKTLVNKARKFAIPTRNGHETTKSEEELAPGAFAERG